MIDIESEDRRLIEETINRFPAFSYGTGLEIILTEFAKRKNKVFASQYKDLLDRRIEELALEQAKDNDGIPVRVVLARDFALSMMGSRYLHAETSTADIVKFAVKMADEMLDELKKSEL